MLDSPRTCRGPLLGLLALPALLALVACSAERPAPVPQGAALTLEHAIELPGVEGRIDHMALDPGRDLLYVAALGNDTLEVVDLTRRAVLRSIAAEEPQGVLYLAELDRVAFTNARSGTLEVLDGATLERVARVEVGGDADNLRHDARAQQVVVAVDGGLALVDTATWTIAGKIELPGHAESFQLDPAGGRAFVNVPAARALELVDLATRNAQAIEVVEARDNYPLAWLPAEGGRPGLVLLGCRSPAKLLVRSAEDGRGLAALDLAQDTDDIEYDRERRRVYVACGGGTVDVFARTDEGLEPLGRVPTAPGARTCLFVPERDRLFVAAPQRGETPARVLILSAE